MCGVAQRDLEWASRDSLTDFALYTVIWIIPADAPAQITESLHPARLEQRYISGSSFCSLWSSGLMRPAVNTDIFPSQLWVHTQKRRSLAE